MISTRDYDPGRDFCAKGLICLEAEGHTKARCIKNLNEKLGDRHRNAVIVNARLEILTGENYPLRLRVVGDLYVPTEGASASWS